MLALLLMNSLRLMDDELKRYTQSQVQDYRELLDASLSLTLFQRDHASMVEMLDKLLSRPESGLKYVLVQDDNGKTYAAAGSLPKDILPMVDFTVSDAMSDGVFDAVGSLSLDVVPVGAVRFGVSLEGMIETKNALFNQGVLIASVEVLLSLMLLSFIGYVLTRHLDRIVAATRDVTKGNYDIRISKDSDDEIGQLAERFNQMALAIRERIAALQTSERVLFEEKEKAWVTLHSIGDGVITTDSEGRVEMLNPISERLTGWTQDEARGRPIEEIFVIQDELSRRPTYNPIVKCLRSNSIVELDEHTVLVARDGAVIPINDSAAPIRDSDENIIGAVLVFQDVSSTRKLASQLAYQARHDALTGLVNRTECERRLQQAVDSAINEGRHHVLCYMDLDQFKVVNDTCGHIAGDELLRQVTVALKARVRDSDTLARLGGDEFGVLLENCPLSRAAVVAEQLRMAVKDINFTWEGRRFDSGVSVGVVAVDKNCKGIAEVLSAADVACYLAKEQGRNRVYFHHQGDLESERRQSEMHVVSHISAALETDRFELYVQEIRSLQSQQPRHYEVLLRMRDVQGELISPVSFIPAAERFHMMHQVDAWVVKQALDLVRKHRLHDKGLHFSINLSGQSLAREDFLELLLSAIRDSGVPPASLCFEVTETAAISNLVHAGQFISALKGIGCTFALDDFGSGLSSFAYLKNLDVDYLKIDGGFVKDMLIEGTDAAMVEAINQIGHVMGLQTIAEYVEDEHIMARLVSLGVDYGQGFGIHRPEPMRQLIAQLGSAKIMEFPGAS